MYKFSVGQLVYHKVLGSIYSIREKTMLSNRPHYHLSKLGTDVTVAYVDEGDLASAEGILTPDQKRLGRRLVDALEALAGYFGDENGAEYVKSAYDTLRDLLQEMGVSEDAALSTGYPPQLQD